MKNKLIQLQTELIRLQNIFTFHSFEIMFEFHQFIKIPFEKLFHQFEKDVHPF